MQELPGWDKDNLIRKWKKKNKKTKSVMYSETAHHLTSVSQFPSNGHSLSFIVQHDPTWYDTCLWLVGVSHAGSVHSQFLVHPQLSTGRAAQGA